jgi:hypothetical protein
MVEHHAARALPQRANVCYVLLMCDTQQALVEHQPHVPYRESNVLLCVANV